MKKILLLIAIATLVTTNICAAESNKKPDLIKEMEFAAKEKKSVPKTIKEMEFVIEIKNNKFIPETLEVPANQGFRLIVKNSDKTLEEFESHDLKKEKIVKGGKEITLAIQALEPGEYKFFGEFHPKTAQGKIIAK